METLDCISLQGRGSALPAALDADSSSGLARPQPAASSPHLQRHGPGSTEPPTQPIAGAAGAGKGPGAVPAGPQHSPCGPGPGCGVLGAPSPRSLPRAYLQGWRLPPAPSDRGSLVRRAPAHTGGGPVPCRGGSELLSWRVCMAMALGYSFCFPSEPWGCRHNCLSPVRPASCAGEVGGGFYSILGTTEPEAVSLLDSFQAVLSSKAATLPKSGSTFGGDFRSFRELIEWVKSTHNHSRDALSLLGIEDPSHSSLWMIHCHWLTMFPGNITVPPALPLNIGRLSCCILEFENGSFCVDLSKSLLLCLLRVC